MSTLLFCDSFDHYSVAQGNRKYTTFGGSGVGIVAGRTGNGLAMGESGLGGSATITFAQGVQAEITAGFAINLGTTKGIPFIAANAASGLQADISVLGDGRLQMTIHTTNNTVTVGPTTFVFSSGIWYFFEIQLSVAASVVGGNSRATVTYDIKVNGSTILSGVTTCDWIGTVNPTQISWSYSGFSGSLGCTIDDFYITDTEFLGDISIQPLYPAGDSTPLQWTPLGGGTHFSKVNEHTADDDSSYVTDDGSVLNDIDLYTVDQITAIPTPAIKGVQLCICVKNDVAGSSTVVDQLKSGGTTHSGVAVNLTTNTYLYSLDPYRKSPFSAIDWTVAEVNAMTVGVKRTA